MLVRLRAAVEQREDFAIETTLASRSYAQQIPAWQEAGHRVTMHFIEVPDAVSRLIALPTALPTVATTFPNAISAIAMSVVCVCSMKPIVHE